MSTPEGKSYKDTLFLPKTDFPMKGNLTVREPARLDKWNSEDLYARIIAKRKAENAPRFILHDGPPFANGGRSYGNWSQQSPQRLRGEIKDNGRI